MKTLYESILGSMGMGDNVTWIDMISPILIEFHKLMKKNSDWEFDKDSLEFEHVMSMYSISFDWIYMGDKSIKYDEQVLRKILIDIMDKLHYKLDMFISTFEEHKHENSWQSRYNKLSLTFDPTGQYDGDDSDPYKFKVSLNARKLNSQMNMPKFTVTNDAGFLKIFIKIPTKYTPEFTEDRFNKIKNEIKSVIK